jgi:membrane protein required for colicin V production
MNLFDIFLVGIIALSGLSGLRTGFARVVIHLAATFIALMAAFWGYGMIALRLRPWIEQPIVADVVGFCVVFFGIMILGSLIGMVLARLFALIGLGWLDHLLGGAAGILRGAFLAAVVVAILLAFLPVPPPAFLTDSKILPYATSVSSAIAELAPKGLRDEFIEHVQKLKQHRWDTQQKQKEGIV